MNLLGVLYGTRAFWPTMLAQGHGHVVNVASLAGRFATPGASVYTATKHAVVALSESLFYEGESHGVLVTAVNPGLVATEGFPQDHVPSRLVMRPERVAEAIVRVVREDIAPELAVPRWIGPLEAFRVLTPPLYRWGVRKTREVGMRATKARPETGGYLFMEHRSGRDRTPRHRDERRRLPPRRALDRHRLERPGEPHDVRHLGLPEPLRLPARAGDEAHARRRTTRAGPWSRTARASAASPTSRGCTPTACGRRCSRTDEPSGRLFAPTEACGVEVRLPPGISRGARRASATSSRSCSRTRIRRAILPSRASAGRLSGRPTARARVRTARRRRPRRRTARVAAPAPRHLRRRVLDEEESLAWLRTLNDLRLVLGSGWPSPRRAGSRTSRTTRRP